MKYFRIALCEATVPFALTVAVNCRTLPSEKPTLQTLPVWRKRRFPWYGKLDIGRRINVVVHVAADVQADRSVIAVAGGFGRERRKLPRTDRRVVIAVLRRLRAAQKRWPSMSRPIR